MNAELEWAIRSKIADLQIYLGSGRASSDELMAIDHHLGKALEVTAKPEARSSACETS